MRHFTYNIFCLIIVLLFFSILFLLITNNEKYYTYEQFTSNYNKKYDYNDYSTSELEANNLTHNLVMSSLINSNEFLNGSSISTKFNSFLKTITNSTDFDSYLKEKQYDEPQISNASAQFIQTYESNMYYEGYLSDNTKVKGNLSVYEEKEEYILVLSFVNENNEFDINKLKLLADDSNSEKIVYDIISYMQYIYQTNMTPDVASRFFFQNNVEEIAGSISYHATSALYILENNLNKPIALKRLKQVNISTIDMDSFIVNQNY